MMHYLNSNRLLCDSQFGFREKNQPVHVLLHMMNLVAKHALANKTIIATFIDPSKAFNCLQYDKLFKKMNYLGSKHPTITCFKS